MRLLRTDTDDLILDDVYDEYEENPTKYAILSHTWLADGEEVKFADLHLPLQELRGRKGWSKIEGCKRQAVSDGWKYVWIDTLCIDKSSSSELSEAINSMYRWYEKSQACYIYLQDMPDPVPPVEYWQRPENQAATHDCHFGDGDEKDNKRRKLEKEMPISGEKPWFIHLPLTKRLNMAGVPMETLLRGTLKHVSRTPDTPPNHHILDDGSVLDLVAFRRCRWFQRGWTLQEQLAPHVVKFFSKSWSHIPDSMELLREISTITRIHLEAVCKGRRIEAYSIAQRLSWAAHRKTSRIEDRTYSLLGILNVNMVINYGEGRRAFRRLQEELLRRSDDQTIFAFERYPSPLDWTTHILAESPSDFAQSGDIACAILGGGSSFQLTGPAITFHAPTIATGTAIDDPELQAIILACRLISDQSKYVVLNVRRYDLAERTTTHWVSDDPVGLIDMHYAHTHLQPRHCISSLSTLPMDAESSSTLWFTPYSMIRRGRRREVSNTLLCRFQRNSGPTNKPSLHQTEGWKFTNATQLSPLMRWNELNSSFQWAACPNDHFGACIEVCSQSGRLITRLRIQGNSVHGSDFSVRFDNGSMSISLPWWVAHGEALRWNENKSVILARALYTKTLKGIMPVIEVGSASPLLAATNIFVSLRGSPQWHFLSAFTF